MNHDVTAFLKVLDPADTTTGGGAAAALAGAMAGALVAMVARLSPGREGTEAPSFYERIATEAGSLSHLLLAGGREDFQAFEAVRAAFRLPKGTDEERGARQVAIQAAWRHAAHVPLANAERCGRVLALAAALLGRSNPNAASDLACAIHLARAGLLGCAENVKINLPAINDEQVVAALSERLGALPQMREIDATSPVM
jgi:methenyltetrahydrofolate cyclohydrolase